MVVVTMAAAEEAAAAQAAEASVFIKHLFNHSLVIFVLILIFSFILATPGTFCSKNE